MTFEHAQLKNERLEEFIRRVPKTEMHLHLEGAIRWQTVRELHPDGARLPKTPAWLQGDYRFSAFDEFIQTFRNSIQPASGTAEAVERITREVLVDLAAQNVKYAEIILVPRWHTTRGLDLEGVLESIARARATAESDLDIEAKFIYGLNRHHPPDEALDDFQRSLAIAGPAGSGLLAGLDLQGDERLALADEHVEAFSIARRQGLRVKAHAGELCDPGNVRATIDTLGVEHVMHGVRLADDPELLEDVAERGVYVHMSPTSNVRLRVVESYAAHPLKSLLDAGCRVTISSDDPLLFGVMVTDEYRNALTRLGLTVDELTQVIKNGFHGSLLPEDVRSGYLAEIDGLREALGEE